MRLAKFGDRMAVTPNLSVGLTGSSGCSGDDDGDGDDEVAFAGDKVASSRAAAGREGLPEPGAEVGHIGCSPSGDGVDVAVW